VKKVIFSVVNRNCIFVIFDSKDREIVGKSGPILSRPSPPAAHPHAPPTPFLCVILKSELQSPKGANPFPHPSPLASSISTSDAQHPHVCFYNTFDSVVINTVRPDAWGGPLKRDKQVAGRPPPPSKKNIAESVVNKCKAHPFLRPIMAESRGSGEHPPMGDFA